MAARGIFSHERIAEVPDRQLEQRLGMDDLEDKNLAYFKEGSEYFDDYVEAVGWAQDYAMEDRRQIKPKCVL